MDFTNQLHIKIAGDAGRMCSNIIEVDDFLRETIDYTMSDVEYQALDDFLQSVLPEREFAPEEKRRYAIYQMSDGSLIKGSHTESPEGAIRIADIYNGAYSTTYNNIAQFYLGLSKGLNIMIRISRKKDTESQPLSFMEDCWNQQAVSFKDDRMTKVMADLSPLKPQKFLITSEKEYTLKSGQMEFDVDTPADMLYALKCILLRPVSRELKNIVYDIFNHLNHFERFVAFSMPVQLYCDDRHVLYASGDGTNNTRRLWNVGQFYTQYFSGLPGNIFKLNLSAFENENLNILLVRNGERL